MDAKQKIEISLRSSIIIGDMARLIDCGNIDSMLEDFRRAVGRMHELDKVLFDIKDNDGNGGEE